MLQNFRFLVYGAALSLVLYAYPSFAVPQCATHNDIVSGLMHEGFGLLSTATTAQMYVIQVFVNDKTRDWVMIGIDNDMNTCLLAQGSNWIYALERRI